MWQSTSFNRKHTLAGLNSFFESHAIYAVVINVAVTLYFFLLNFSLNIFLIASLWTLFITIVIDIMYHRYYAHKSFQFKSDTLRKTLSILTIAGGYGSYITLSLIHI